MGLHQVEDLHSFLQFFQSVFQTKILQLKMDFWIVKCGKQVKCDQLMADRGFTIEDYLSPLGVKLVIPTNSDQNPDQTHNIMRRTHIWLLNIFRYRKLIIFTGISLFSIWKLYQRKEESLLIVVVSLISWIVLGIIRKSKKIE